MQSPGGDNTHVARAETPYATRFLLQTPCSTISQASGLQYMDSTGPIDPMEYTMGTRRQTALTDISNQIITGSCIIKPSSIMFSFYYFLLLMSNLFANICSHNQVRPMNMSVIGRRGIENNENTVQEERLKKPTKKGRREIKECVIIER